MAAAACIAEATVATKYAFAPLLSRAPHSRRSTLPKELSPRGRPSPAAGFGCSAASGPTNPNNRASGQAGASATENAPRRVYALRVASGRWSFSGGNRPTGEERRWPKTLGAGPTFAGTASGEQAAKKHSCLGERLPPTTVVAGGSKGPRRQMPPGRHSSPETKKRGGEHAVAGQRWPHSAPQKAEDCRWETAMAPGPKPLNRKQPKPVAQPQTGWGRAIVQGCPWSGARRASLSNCGVVSHSGAMGPSLFLPAKAGGWPNPHFHEAGGSHRRSSKRRAKI